LIKGAADLPGDAIRVVSPQRPGQTVVSPVELQQQLLRFTDDFSSQLVSSVDALKVGEGALDRTEIVEFKLAFTKDIIAIATGPSVYANLLDMMSVATLLRMTVEDRLIPQSLGSSGEALLEVCRRAEGAVWALSETVLSEAQQDELRSLVEQWHAMEPELKTILKSRALGFTGQLKQDRNEARKRPSSVFGLLMIDPLAGLDPATRELTETRLFAERALFIAQRMPRILRWETKLLSYDTAESPEVRSMLEDANRLSRAAEQVGTTVEALPELLERERREWVGVLEKQQPELRDLSAEVGTALQSGAEMSAATERALVAFERVLERLEGMKSPDAAEGEGTDLADVAAAAERIESAAAQLESLLKQFDTTLASPDLDRLEAKAGNLVTEVETSGAALVHLAFQRALVVLLLASLLAFALLAYHHRQRRRPAATNSPQGS
jgi:hypothetical protein